MPRNNELHRILLIGSGPIVIGQGCEFDYSGVQACKALREEGYQVLLVNSNPATIMTDPEFADRTYIEPITPEVIEAIVERERPDALLPTMGGQTALNAAMALYRNGALARHAVKLIGANAQAIAKVAAKLAVGYTLDEIRNDITRETPACFEPTIDYCVVKVPRFTFEKFPQADPTLTTQMKSVGEAMAIGRTFKEALQKALRSLEIKRFGLTGDGADKDVDLDSLRLKLATPNAERIFQIAQALQKGASIDGVYELTKIDKWFLRNVAQIVGEAGQAGSIRDESGRMPELRAQSS